MHMPIRETSQCINWRAEAKFCLSRSTNLRLSPDVASARGFVKPRSVAPLSKKGWCLVTTIKQCVQAFLLKSLIKDPSIIVWFL